MAGTRLLVVAALALPAAAALVACVEVPDHVRAHFAEPRAGERSNYRRGPKGTAAPVEPAALFAPAAPAAPVEKVASVVSSSPTSGRVGVRPEMGDFAFAASRLFDADANPPEPGDPRIRAAVRKLAEERFGAFPESAGERSSAR